MTPAGLLDALPGAAALCDRSLRVTAASERFAELAGAPPDALRGLPLSQALPPAPGQALRLPATGAPATYEASTRSGAVRVRLALHGDVVGVLAEPLDTAARVLVTLGRELTALASEEEIVAAVARAVRALYPGKWFAVRALDPASLDVLALAAEGPPSAGPPSAGPPSAGPPSAGPPSAGPPSAGPPSAGPLRAGPLSAGAPIALKPASAERMGLLSSSVPAERLVFASPLPPIFEGSARSLAVPLVAAGLLYGVVTVESAEEGDDLERAEPALLQLANQAASALRVTRQSAARAVLESLVERIVEGGEALVVGFTADRNIAVFNAAAERLTGLSRADAIGRPCGVLDAPGAEGRLAEALAAVAGGEAEVAFECGLRSPGGTARVVFHASLMSTGAGVPGLVLAIGQDLTRLRTLEERLAHAEKLATLGRLAAGIAHEMTNPLSTVTLWAESLANESRLGDPARLAKVRAIAESADHVLRLARDLLAYARPPSVEAPRDVDVHAAIEQAVRFCESALRDRGVHLTRRFAAARPLVLGSARDLAQVFVNLLTNAAHAVGPGGHVEVRTAVENGAVTCEVADDGAGMDAATAARAFEPFFTTKGASQGTGLGLSIAKGFVEGLGGTIGVVTAPGAGATFTLRLPAI